MTHRIACHVGITAVLVLTTREALADTFLSNVSNSVSAYVDVANGSADGGQDGPNQASSPVGTSISTSASTSLEGGPGVPFTYASGSATSFIESQSIGTYAIHATASSLFGGRYPGVDAHASQTFTFTVTGSETIQLDLDALTVSSTAGYPYYPSLNYGLTDAGNVSLFAGGFNVQGSAPTSISKDLGPGTYTLETSVVAFAKYPDDPSIPYTMNISAGFRVVITGATESPGLSQQTPIMPVAHAGRDWRYISTPSGAWIDPETADSFTYTTTDGSLITGIDGLPTGFAMPFTVLVDGAAVGDFTAGDTVDFVALLGHGVPAFTIAGIDPAFDSSDPGAFPIALAFDHPTADLIVTPGSVPEPGTLAFGVLALALLAKRRHKPLEVR